VSSGPFAVRTRSGDVIETTRSDGSSAALSGVSLHLFPDAASAHAAFVRGEVDVSVLSLDEVAVAGAAGELVVSAQQQVSLFYGMNVKSPALSSIAVRQAIVKAVDRDAIRRTVFGDAADTMTGLLGPGVSARRPDACGNACGYDPEGAKFVLAQAFPDGGVPLVHVDHFDEPTGREAAIANALAANLNAVGIPTQVRAHPFDQYGAVVTSGNAGVFRFGWIGAFASADAYLDPLFASSGSDNVFALADPDVDAALAEARSAADDSARMTAVLRAEDRIIELNVVVPLVQYRAHLVVSPEVRDVVMRHDGTFDAERITLLPS
jgi:ABC-type oligopeptide transport system substrate-binding subunit